MEDDELLVDKPEIFLYNIPWKIQRKQGYIHRASEWNINEPDWYGKILVYKAGTSCHIQLEDRKGSIHGQAVLNVYPGDALVPVLDSSRYFTLRMQKVDGSYELVGIGFTCREDSADFDSALLAHFGGQTKKRKYQEMAEEVSAKVPKPSGDSTDQVDAVYTSVDSPMKDTPVAQCKPVATVKAQPLSGANNHNKQRHELPEEPKPNGSDIPSHSEDQVITKPETIGTATFKASSPSSVSTLDINSETLVTLTAEKYSSVSLDESNSNDTAKSPSALDDTSESGVTRASPRTLSKSMQNENNRTLADLKSALPAEAKVLLVQIATTKSRKPASADAIESVSKQVAKSASAHSTKAELKEATNKSDSNHVSKPMRSSSALKHTTTKEATCFSLKSASTPAKRTALKQDKKSTSSKSKPALTQSTESELKRDKKSTSTKSTPAAHNTESDLKQDKKSASTPATKMRPASVSILKLPSPKVVPASISSLRTPPAPKVVPVSVSILKEPATKVVSASATKGVGSAKNPKVPATKGVFASATTSKAPAVMATFPSTTNSKERPIKVASAFATNPKTPEPCHTPPTPIVSEVSKSSVMTPKKSILKKSRTCQPAPAVQPPKKTHLLKPLVPYTSPLVPYGDELPSPPPTDSPEKPKPARNSTSPRSAKGLKKPVATVKPESQASDSSSLPHKESQLKSTASPRTDKVALKNSLKVNKCSRAAYLTEDVRKPILKAQNSKREAVTPSRAKESVNAGSGVAAKNVLNGKHALKSNKASPKSQLHLISAVEKALDLTTTASEAVTSQTKEIPNNEQELIINEEELEMELEYRPDPLNTEEQEDPFHALLEDPLKTDNREMGQDPLRPETIDEEEVPIITQNNEEEEDPLNTDNIVMEEDPLKIGSSGGEEILVKVMNSGGEAVLLKVVNTVGEEDPLKVVNSAEEKDPLKVGSIGEEEDPLKVGSIGEEEDPLKVGSIGEEEDPLKVGSIGEEEDPLKVGSIGEEEDPLKVGSIGEEEDPLKVIPIGEEEDPLKVCPVGEEEDHLKVGPMGEEEDHLKICDEELQIEDFEEVDLFATEENEELEDPLETGTSEYQQVGILFKNKENSTNKHATQLKETSRQPDELEINFKVQASEEFQDQDGEDDLNASADCDFNFSQYAQEANLLGYEYIEGNSFQCHKCPKTFTDVRRIKSHWKNVHNMKNPGHCVICKLPFPNRAELAQHRKNSHGHKCKLCGKQFKKPFGLKEHSRLVHKKALDFACTQAQCSASFPLKVQLMKHIESHENETGQAILHQCPVCHSKFLTAEDLAGHALTHVKNYSCDECGQRFRSKGPLKQHYRTLHPDCTLPTNEDLQRKCK